MAANVRFLRTSKETQNNRTIFNQNTLYFVRDSRQLYQGENLLTSGIRLVEALPEAHLAAEQVIYFIVAQQTGYTVDRSKLQTAPQEAWVRVITPVSQAEVTWEELEARKYVTAQALANYVTQDNLTTAIQQLREDLTPIVEQVEQVVPKVEQVATVVEEQVVPVVLTLSRIANEPTVQALTSLAGTADQLTELVQVAATQTWVEQHFLTPEDLATTLDNLDIITSEQVQQQLTNYAIKDHTHDQYLTQQSLDDYAKKSDLFSQDYNDLTNKPQIPSIDGLASEQFVKEQLEKLDINTFVPFATDKFVSKALGGFTVGANVNGFTLAQLFTTLLGLVDTNPQPDVPDIPTEPDSVVEEIVANKTPMYQLNENDELVEVDFVEPIKYTVEAADVTAVIEEARLINDGQVGFYQVVSGAGEVVESGYQDITESKEPWYIIALPESLEVARNGNVELLTWDNTATPPAWVAASYVLTGDYTEIKAAYEDAGLEPPVAPTGYKLWADLSESDPGTQYRFVIKDKE